MSIYIKSMETKLAVMYSVGVPGNIVRCTGVWSIVHDGTVDGFKEVLKKATKVWYEYMLSEHKQYTEENFIYDSESCKCKTLGGIEVIVEDIAILFREDIKLEN